MLQLTHWTVIIDFLLRAIPSVGIGISKKCGITFSNVSIGKQEFLSK